jgi:hypothetical protein
MSEPHSMDQFAARLAEHVQAYTDPAAARRIDALEVSREAKASGRPIGWSGIRLGGHVLGGPAGLGWVTVFVAIALIGVAAVAVQRGPAEPFSGPIPEVIRHAWARPFVVEPAPDVYGSGFLDVTEGQLEYGREPGAAASSASITAAGPDSLRATATAGSRGCAVGDVGTYRWTLEGKDTFMTLTVVGADGCAARELALTGPWVRSDLGPPPEPGATLAPGAHRTNRFDPFGDPAAPTRLAFTVPEGWKIKDDQPTIFVLHRLADAAQGPSSSAMFVALLTQPRMAEDFAPGVACGPVADQPGIGTSVDELVAAIVARPGVVSTPPATVTVAGHEGRVLDLRVADSWTGGCQDAGAFVVSLPLLHGAGLEPGPMVALGRDQPLRLILVDLSGGRTLAVIAFLLGPVQPAAFEADVAEVMPIVESLEFQPTTP